MNCCDIAGPAGQTETEHNHPLQATSCVMKTFTLCTLKQASCETSADRSPDAVAGQSL